MVINPLVMEYEWLMNGQQKTISASSWYWKLQVPTVRKVIHPNQNTLIKSYGDLTTINGDYKW